VDILRSKTYISKKTMDKIPFFFDKPKLKIFVKILFHLIFWPSAFYAIMRTYYRPRLKTHTEMFLYLLDEFIEYIKKKLKKK